MARSLTTLLAATAVAAGMAAVPATATTTAAAEVPGTATPTPTLPATASVTAAAAPLPSHERAAAVAAAQDAAARAARTLGLSSRERLHVEDLIVDPDGTRHVRYTRTYAGLPVVAGDLVIHTNPSGTRTVDWASHADLAVLGVPRPRLAAPRAALTAAAASSLTPVAAAPRLVVFARGDRARLAWAVTVAGRDAAAPAREVSYVDADTGAPLAGWSLLQHARGRGHSLYSGTVGLTTARPRARAPFQLRDTARGGHQVRDMHNVTRSTATGTLFIDRNNVWGNGRPTSRQSAAVDAAYGAAVTWDYYRIRHRRHGIANNGRAAVSRVHFGRNLENAFWFDGCFCMTYGDGGSRMRPVVSLDVVGHEMTHGVTSTTADLAYIGESGGLNEATSDIFGTLVELHAVNPRDPGDYLVGEEVVRTGGFLRRMDHPSRDGGSFDCWVPEIGVSDVHQSSGVGNHFFYLLAEGSGPKVIGGVTHNSPTCDGAPVSGIGRAAAARIWYRALTVYMTSSTHYTDGRDATIRAARDLFGDGSAACTAVVRAWDAVAVPAGAYACTGRPTATGPNSVTNPGFEAGDTAWAGGAGVADQRVDLFRFPHSGRGYARFNDQGSANTDTISQRVSVPAGSPRLRFELNIATENNGPANADTFAAEVVDAAGTATRLATFTAADARFTYRTASEDLSAFAGQTVTLRFTGTEDAAAQTFFLLDDVSVTPN